MKGGMEPGRPAQRDEPVRGRYRYLVVAIIWLGFVLVGVDKAAISLLLVDAPFLREMGLEGSPEKQGLLMTFLLLPYALSNILLSPGVDRWGPRKALTLMAGLWAAAAFWMGAIGSYGLMLVGRAVRGTAEGPLFPLANCYVRRWFPAAERGGANAIWTSGARVGLALAVPVLAWVIGMWGWRSAFLVQGVVIALCIVPAIWLLTADSPERMPRVGAAELAHIRQGEAPQTAGPRGGSGELALLLRNYRFWLMVFYHFAVLATASGLITWLPKYLREARGFEVGQMVLFSALPQLGCFLSSLTFGFLSDRLGHRALLCTISQAGSAAAVGLATLVENPVASAWLMVLGMVLWGIGPPIYYAIMQRIVPPAIIATGIGIDNGLANFGAALSPAVIGFLIGATGSYVGGLLFVAVLGLVGAAGAAVLALQRY